MVKVAGAPYYKQATTGPRMSPRYGTGTSNRSRMPGTTQTVRKRLRQNQPYQQLWINKSGSNAQVVREKEVREF